MSTEGLCHEVKVTTAARLRSATNHLLMFYAGSSEEEPHIINGQVNSANHEMVDLACLPCSAWFHLAPRSANVCRSRVKMEIKARQSPSRELSTSFNKMSICIFITYWLLLQKVTKLFFHKSHSYVRVFYTSVGKLTFVARDEVCRDLHQIVRELQACTLARISLEKKKNLRIVTFIS